MITEFMHSEIAQFAEMLCLHVRIVHGLIIALIVQVSDLF